MTNNQEKLQPRDELKDGYNQKSDNAEMSKYGITRQRVDYYLFETFRYTSLKEAIAQAKRCEHAGQL